MPDELSAFSYQPSAIASGAAWGLYISVPFCRFKCTYCNFASGVFAQRELERYIDALVREMDNWGRHTHQPASQTPISGSRIADDQLEIRNPQPVPAQPGSAIRNSDTVYLGGGTPSILSPAQLERVFTALRANFTIPAGAEITLEAAPGSITPELAECWRRLGVNRISLGVQSFVERELKAVGRPHRAETVARELELLRRGGIHNANIDLIAGLPHQTPAGWDESLDWIARLQPEHVSVYILEIDEDSRLGSEILAGGPRYSAESVPGEDATADLYCHAIDRLEDIGCRQYEISNFARPGCESRHNRKYWEQIPYLGFGVDAHSFDGAQRWANSDSLESYLEAMENGRSPVIARCNLDARHRTEERIFLGLRLNQGLELAAEEHERYRREIDKMSHAGLLESSGGRLRLTRRGRLLSNEVFAEFIE